MTAEKGERRTRFENEKKPRFRLAEGSWESVLVGLKSTYPEDVFGVSDTDYWEQIEEKATMNLKEACFQYYLAGIGHLTLARKVVESNSQIRTSVGLGVMSTRDRDEIADSLSIFLYDNYPEKYKKRIKK